MKTYDNNSSQEVATAYENEHGKNNIDTFVTEKVEVSQYTEAGKETITTDTVDQDLETTMEKSAWEDKTKSQSEKHKMFTRIRSSFRITKNKKKAVNSIGKKSSSVSETSSMETADSTTDTSASRQQGQNMATISQESIETSSTLAEQEDPKRSRSEHYQESTHPRLGQYTSRHTIEERMSIHHENVIVSSIVNTSISTRRDVIIHPPPPPRRQHNTPVGESPASWGDSLHDLALYFTGEMSNHSSHKFRKETYALTKHHATGLSHSNSYNTIGSYYNAVDDSDDDTFASFISKSSRKKKNKKGKQYYYTLEDLDLSNWTSIASNNPGPSIGMAVLATATIIVHPIIFLTGALWAVGILHAVDHGYEFFSDRTFGNYFWADDEYAENMFSKDLMLDNAPSAVVSSSSNDSCSTESIPTTAPPPPLHQNTIETKNSQEIIAAQVKRVKLKANFLNGCDEINTTKEKERCISNRADASLTMQQHAKTNETVQSAHELNPIAPMPDNSSGDNHTLSIVTRPLSPASSPSNASTIFSPCGEATTQHLINTHFPPLKKCVISNTPFSNLHAAEFFHVFFSDHAPFSLKEFQQERGDIEVQFGDWGEPSLDHTDFHPPFVHPNATVKERSIQFKTLTKSYFGPAYAQAHKIQRVTRVKDQFMVLENRTKLIGIPYADRFQIMERWVVQTVRTGRDQAGLDNNDTVKETKAERKQKKKKKKTTNNSKISGIVSNLTVHQEVQMLKSCSWESQIKKTTESTMKELVDSWCKKATIALQLAEQNKAQRIRKTESNTSDDLILTSKRDIALHQDSSASPLSQVSLPPSPMSPQYERELVLSDEQSNFKDNSCGTTNTMHKDKEELMAVHENKLKELEKKIATGDIEGCSVELKHMLVSGRSSVMIMGSSMGELTGQQNEVVQSVTSLVSPICLDKKELTQLSGTNEREQDKTKKMRDIFRKLKLR